MRLFGATITALDEAVQNGGDPLELIDEAVGWHRLVAAKAQVDALADLAGEDALVTATERYATLRRFSPAFLDAFTFKASGTGTALIKAIDVIRDANTRKRSEEHTSELQSLMRISYAVFCLKNKKLHINHNEHYTSTHTKT